MKTDLSCYLCFSKAEDYTDVLSEEGIKINMKSILLQHYGFLEVIVNSTIKFLNNQLWFL